MFGTPSQSGAGELLFSGGGGGLRSGSSGDAPQAGPPGPIGGLGAGTSSFDLSNDFPTLGGGGPGLGGGGIGTIGGGGGAAGLAGTLRQQQLLQQQQQYRIATAGQGNINIAKEDFPALGSPVQQAQRSGGGDIAGLGGAGAVGSSTSNGGMNNPIFNGLAGGIASLNLQDSSASSSGGNPGGTKSSSSGGGGGPDGAPGTAINSEYGLLGLLSLIRMSESDRNALALGEDLSVLGLSLSTSARILDTFGGPFTDKVAATDFRYNVSIALSSLIIKWRDLAALLMWLFCELSSSTLFFSFPMRADTLLVLCRLSTVQARKPDQVESGKSLLHVLWHAEGCISGSGGGRAVQSRLEIPRRASAMVQACGARRWCRSWRRVAQVHLLRLHGLDT